jgi:putative endonuclease
MASKPSGTLYIGVTSDLVKRVWEHKNDSVDGFTKRYCVHHLIYCELHGDMLISDHTREAAEEMESGVEAGIDRGAEFWVDRSIRRDHVSVGECLDSRFHGNDGPGKFIFCEEIHSASVTPECLYRGSRSELA